MRLADGLAYVILRPGSESLHPAADDHVVVHYSLWLPTGQLFDSTVVKRKPATFLVGGVLPGWQEAFAQLTKGEKARFWIPAALGFKEGTGPSGPHVLEVELLQLLKGTAPEAAPANLQVPMSARHLANGLRMEVLQPGKGHKHPKPTDPVALNYTGWTAEGALVDSSHGHPITFRLADRMRGWQEGVSTMVEGEKARLWIPAQLAEAAGPAAHQPVVFDVELVRIGLGR